MTSLPLKHRPTPGEPHGCGTTCGAGLERVYPVTAVRFGAMNWIGEFKYRPGTVFKCGAKVVIETDRGVELGQQVSLSCSGCNKQVTREQIKAYIEQSGAESYRLNGGMIIREATPDDVEDQRRLNLHVDEDIARCAELAAQFDLDLKVVTSEHLLGGERVVYYFRSEQRVDFRALVRELAHFHRTRIEMRQVRPRDEARLVADFEVCGRECCCKNFLKKLRPVTMRMAKVQKATLDPSKVSGRCGLLRCCLRYEHTGYEDLNAKLPPTGSLVETEFGPADVVDRQILTQLLLVRLADGRQMTIPLEEVRAVTLPADRATRSVVPDVDPDARRGGRTRREPGGAAPPGERPARPRDRGPREAPAEVPADERGRRGGEPEPASDNAVGSDDGTRHIARVEPVGDSSDANAARSDSAGAEGRATAPGLQPANRSRRRRRRRRGDGPTPDPAAPGDAGADAPMPDEPTPTEPRADRAPRGERPNRNRGGGAAPDDSTSDARTPDTPGPDSPGPDA